jgi:peptide/nickel transport system substrate-binding protein
VKRDLIVSSNIKIKKLALLLIVSLLMATALLSEYTGSMNASSGGTPTSAPVTITTKDTLVIGDDGTHAITDLDPVTSPNQLWNYRITECLVEVNQDGSLSPGLAKSWENVDGTHWIFHLRDNVKFQDGKPMTADDVKYALDRSMSQSASNKVQLAFKQCNVIDKYTVEFVTDKPDASIPGRLSSSRAAIYSDTSETNKKGVITKPIATGPFKIASYDMATETLYLDRFDDYYNGIAKLAHIIIKANMANPNSREMAIEKGEVDLTVEPTIASTSRLEKNPDLHVYVYDWNGQYMIKYGNLTKEPYNDVRVRKAMAYALDRKNIVSSLLQDRGVVNEGNGVPSMAPWYNGNVAGYSYDVAKAKALLKDAGWTDTDGDGIVDKNGKPFKITLYTSTENPAQAIMAPAIQSQLQDIGIYSEIQVLDYSAVSPHSQDWGFIQLTYTVPFLIYDPSYFLENTFMTGGSSNAMKYSNPSVDDLLKQARSEMDTNKRYDLYREVQKIVVDDDCVNIYFASSRYSLITRSDLKGYIPYVTPHNWRINKDMHFE